jgi:hypothetical protein
VEPLPPHDGAHGRVTGQPLSVVEVF